MITLTNDVNIAFDCKKYCHQIFKAVHDIFFT